MGPGSAPRPKQVGDARMPRQHLRPGGQVKHYVRYSSWHSSAPRSAGKAFRVVKIRRQGSLTRQGLLRQAIQAGDPSSQSVPQTEYSNVTR